MSDKDLRLLEVGDEITTIYYLASLTGDDDFEPYTIETITVTANTSFGETTLPDGNYGLIFEMWDAMGNASYSDMVTFDCLNGDIMTTVYE